MMQPARIWYQSFTDPDVDAPYFERRVVAVRAIEAEVEQFNAAFDAELEYQQLRAQFVAQIEPILEIGVDVIILAGGHPMLLFARETGFHVDGATVLNGLPVAIAAAETAIRLARLNRTATSRRSTYALPPGEAVAEFERLLDLPGPAL